VLDKRVIIRQRRLSSLRFNKPIIDPKTGKWLTNKDGDLNTFVPNSYRSNYPVEASASFRDDQPMVMKLEATQKDHNVWKSTMSAHAKDVSWLEIRLREAEKRMFFQICYDYVTRMV
jgi:hypothetical protein